MSVALKLLRRLLDKVVREDWVSADEGPYKAYKSAKTIKASERVKYFIFVLEDLNPIDSPALLPPGVLILKFRDSIKVFDES